MNKSEKEWMAESDMRTLAEAEAIKADKNRLSRAGKAAKRMIREKQQEVNRIEKAVKKPSRKKSLKKPPSRRSSKKK
jgi:hypothetical protein